MSKLVDVVAPSGYPFKLREITGADQDIFSGASGKDFDLINRFIAEITFNERGNPLSTKAVEELILADKYYLLLKARILSLSPILYFTFTWPTSDNPKEYDADLEDYIWDYPNPVPEPDSREYFSQRIKNYEELIHQRDEEGYLHLKPIGDKQFRLKILDGTGEKYLLSLPLDHQTVNQALVARDLQMMDGDKWVKVVNFSALTARELVVIRSFVKETDPDILGLVYINNPETGETQELSLLSIPDFFFPTRI